MQSIRKSIKNITRPKNIKNAMKSIMKNIMRFENTIKLIIKML